MTSRSSKNVDTNETMEPMPIGNAYNSRVSNWNLRMNNKKYMGFVVALALLGIVAVLRVPKPQANNSDIPLTLECPSTVLMTDKTEEETLKKHYLGSKTGGGNDLLKKNITAFLSGFRDTKFDYWGYTYEEMKQASYEWKKNMYAPNINEGETIYESACGIGLNLYMTLEVLQEIKGLEKLVVYGNEFLAENAAGANALFDHGAPFQTRKGSICTGDSTRLDFVPSDSFDLVFTGYISPLYDPLDFGSVRKARTKLHSLCNQTDWKSIKLLELAEQKQRDFTAQWVSEMVRIAKPGKAVICEQIMLPLCEDLADWGGVSKDWWKSAVDEYGWDVDPDSIEFGQDPLIERYHVFMRKNPKSKE